MARYATLIHEAKHAIAELSQAVADAADVELQKTQTAMASQITMMLRSCHTPAERAERMLELLVKQSGVQEGYLYGVSGHSPTIAARRAHSELPPKIDSLAREYLFAEINEQDVTKSGDDLQTSSEGSVDWIGERGERYRPVLLCHPAGDSFAIVGLALLVIEPSSVFVYPAQLAVELSRFAFDSGDISVLMAPA
jgi:hypothetical protein